MSELSISPREEQNKATIGTIGEAMTERIPDERAEKLDAGVELMRKDYENDPTFFTRMGEAAIKRINAERTPDEWYDSVRQNYGALGYNTNPTPSVVAETKRSNDVYQNAVVVHRSVLGYDPGKQLQSRVSRNRF